jgi:hypothetical protein
MDSLTRTYPTGRTRLSKVGLVLLAVSAYPLALMAREILTGWQVERAYAVAGVDARS